MELQKTPYGQRNSKNKEQSWGYPSSWFKILLQSYSNWNIMVLVGKQTYR